MLIVFWTAFVLVITKTTSQQTGCVISVVGSPQNSSLVLSADYGFPDPWDDTAQHTGFYTSAEAIFACPGGHFNQPGLNANGQRVKCTSGSVFLVESLYIYYERLSCTLGDLTRPALSESYDNPNIYCENGTRPLEVGYNIDGNLVSVLTICFDMTRLNPLYSKYRLNPWARAGKNHRLPPSYHFFLLDFYGEDAEIPYNNITATFEDLGLQQYINEQHYLVKGHLAAYEDLYYPFERDATYHLANVAPRWNTIDQGNWKALEDALVAVAASTIFGENATVLTGTLNVATLTNSGGMSVELYLSGSKYPVPKWFWKLIHFPTTNAGAIFFGYNNPYAQKTEVDLEFTNEVCSTDAFFEFQQAWTELQNVDHDDPSSGLIYACRLIPGEILDPVILEIVTNY